VLQRKIRFARASRRAACAAVLLCSALATADAPLVPLTVCEILHDLPAQNGKTVVAIARYSFRQNGRWIGEQACDPASAAPPLLWLTEDAAGAPKPPEDFELDAAVLHRKFVEIQRHTTLGKFKFGDPEYDRWAMVYGRVVTRNGDASKQAAANLIYRGSGAVVFLTPDQLPLR
jgi:hypothetical protein